MEPSKLRVGGIYFGIGYEDDEFTRPMIDTYEYLGTDVDGAPDTSSGPQHFFRFVGSEERLQLKETQISHLVFDVPELADRLEQWAKDNK